MTQPILLTKRETAAILRVSISTIERMLRRGDLPYVKMNHATRILRRDVDAYIESHRIETHQVEMPGEGAA
jgi:excisionase family DNA binding protein